MGLAPFHLAVPVSDLTEARAFYGGVLGCIEGRSSDRWVDFDFYGHQLVTHRSEPSASAGPEPTNEVAGHQVPVRHFGLVLDWDEFPRVERRLRDHRVPFLLEPHVRFQGEPGEQATMFVNDPSGNAIEFKAFRDPGQLFAK